jgi:hypothetical protein
VDEEATNQRRTGGLLIGGSGLTARKLLTLTFYQGNFPLKWVLTGGKVTLGT